MTTSMPASVNLRAEDAARASTGNRRHRSQEPQGAHRRHDEQFDECWCSSTSRTGVNVGIVATAHSPSPRSIQYDARGLVADPHVAHNSRSDRPKILVAGRCAPPIFPHASPTGCAGSAETAWRAMQGKSYGRVDLRVDDAGRPWILEVNPNPDPPTRRAYRAWRRPRDGTTGADPPHRRDRAAGGQGTKAARELLAAPRRARAPRTA